MYKTTLKQREYAKQYRLEHLQQCKESSNSWKRNNKDRVKQLNDKWHPITNPINNPKRIWFKTSSKTLKKVPRIGECSRCHRSVSSGEIKKTDLHHTKYDELDPLANTIELCVRCHRQSHQKGVL